MKKTILIAVGVAVAALILFPVVGIYVGLALAVIAALATIKATRSVMTPGVAIVCVVAALWAFNTLHDKPTTVVAPAKAAAAVPSGTVVVPSDDAVGRAANAAKRVAVAQKQIAADEARAVEYAKAKAQQLAWEKSQRESYERAARYRAQQTAAIEAVEAAQIAAIRGHEEATRVRREADRIASYQGSPSLAQRYPDAAYLAAQAVKAEERYDVAWLRYADAYRAASSLGVPPTHALAYGR